MKRSSNKILTKNVFTKAMHKKARVNLKRARSSKSGSTKTGGSHTASEKATGRAAEVETNRHVTGINDNALSLYGNSDFVLEFGVNENLY